MSWLPLADQILVRPLIAADRTASGLLIPDANREKPQLGVVVRVNELGWREDGSYKLPDVQVGELVAFGKYAGVAFDLDGEDVLLMREREALARRPVASFTLVTHTVTHGIATREVCHLAGGRCEHCPEEPKSALLEEERARLLSEQANQGPDGVRG